MGQAHGREDPPHPGDRRAAARAALLPRRLRRRAHHRPDRDVPRPARRGPHLLQPGAPLGADPADLPAVRALGRRRRLHPRVLRRRLHGRGQRQHVPRLAAHGRDGDRREGDARGDGRRAHALLGVGLRRRARARPRTRRSRARARTSRTCPSSRGRSPARARGRGAGEAGGGSGERDPGGREQAVRHDRGHRRGHRRRLVLRDQEALRARGRHRLRAPRRQARRHRREPAEVEGRRALRRLGRQGGALHLAVRRVQRAAALPRRRAGLHDRHEGRARGHHPRRREDDQRGVARRPSRASA